LTLPFLVLSNTAGHTVVARLFEPHAGRTAVDALEATLAERLQLSDGTPWMNTAEVADYSRAELDWLARKRRS